MGLFIWLKHTIVPKDRWIDWVRYINWAPCARGVVNITHTATTRSMFPFGQQSSRSISQARVCLKGATSNYYEVCHLTGCILLCCFLLSGVECCWVINVEAHTICYTLSDGKDTTLVIVIMCTITVVQLVSHPISLTLDAFLFFLDIRQHVHSIASFSMYTYILWLTRWTFVEELYGRGWQRMMLSNVVDISAILGTNESTYCVQ